MSGVPAVNLLPSRIMVLTGFMYDRSNTVVSLARSHQETRRGFLGAHGGGRSPRKGTDLKFT